MCLSSFFLAILVYVFYSICYLLWGADMEKKHVTFRVEPQLVKKLKFLAVEHDKTLTDLFLEALQDLLKKYEKKKSKK